MAKKNETFQFESSVKKLETIIETMEGGHLPLETALKSFEEGIALVRECQKTLENAEQKIQILMQEQGKSTLEPFIASEDEK